MTPEEVNERLDSEIRKLKSDLKMEYLDRQSKLMNIVGLIAFGMIWGFVIAEMLFLRK